MKAIGVLEARLIRGWGEEEVLVRVFGVVVGGGCCFCCCMGGGFRGVGVIVEVVHC